MHLFWEDYLHRLGTVLGMRMMAIYTQGHLSWDPDLLSTTGIMRTLLVRKTEGGPQHFGNPLPAEIHLNFSLIVISEPQHLLDVANMWLC